MSNLVSIQDFRPRRCAQCGKPMKGVDGPEAPARYCGDECARKAQPDKVIVGAGKGSAMG